jgi:hypothetical protein
MNCRPNGDHMMGEDRLWLNIGPKMHLGDLIEAREPAENCFQSTLVVLEDPRAQKTGCQCTAADKCARENPEYAGLVGRLRIL